MGDVNCYYCCCSFRHTACLRSFPNDQIGQPEIDRGTQNSSIYLLLRSCLIFFRRGPGLLTNSDFFLNEDSMSFLRAYPNVWKPLRGDILPIYLICKLLENQSQG